MFYLQTSKLLLTDLKPIIQHRSLSTTSALLGKRNFRHLELGNKRGTLGEKAAWHKDPNYPFHKLGVRNPVVKTEHNKKMLIREQIPELIVPDLTGFQLKPYVSYRVADVTQSEFTPSDLFQATYAQKITKDFKDGKLDESGQSKEPSEEELIEPEEALLRARKTGSDIL